MCLPFHSSKSPKPLQNQVDHQQGVKHHFDDAPVVAPLHLSIMMVGQKRRTTTTITTAVKQVCFSQEANEEHSDPNSSPSDEECQEMWYQRDELRAFKQTAKNFLFGITDRHSEELRGFESYHNLDRMHNKQLAIQCVLLAQKKNMNQEHLATIAHRCSEIAVEEAFGVGCQDYCEAYQPHMASFLSHTMNRQNNSDDTRKRLLENNNYSTTMPVSKRIRTTL